LELSSLWQPGQRTERIGALAAQISENWSNRVRIGIDALFLRAPSTGMGHYLSRLLEGLDALGRQHDYVLLTPRFSGRPEVHRPRLSRRFRSVTIRNPFARLGDDAERLWWEQVGLVQAACAARIDLLHCPHSALPALTAWPVVLTLHDVIPLVHPEYSHWRTASRLYSRLGAWTATWADALITVSECSREDIVESLGVSGDKVTVIGHAVDPSVRAVTDPATLAMVRKRYGIPGPYLLYLGGFDRRKNVGRLIRAYAALPACLRSEYHLVVAGQLPGPGHPLYPDPRPLVAELALKDRVIFTGYVCGEDNPPLYSGATAFLFPSLYEGYGIPVLEAMACGVPVITSNSSSLPEVIGDAGVLVDPSCEAEITQAMQALLRDPERRAALGTAASRRAHALSWPDVAERTVEVYERVLAARSSSRC